MRLTVAVTGQVGGEMDGEMDVELEAAVDKRPATPESAEVVNELLLPEEELAEAESSPRSRGESKERPHVRQEALWVSALDPYSSRAAVWPLRLLALLGLLALAFVVSFVGRLDVEVAAVAGAGVMAALVTRLVIWLRERVLCDRVARLKAKGQYPMVDWLSFTLIMDAVYNTLFACGVEKDARESPEIRAGAGVHDERAGAEMDEQGRFFFDFVADIGDGFNSTFTVASLMARDKLVVQEREGGDVRSVELPRARVTCVGGDLCYPFSTYENFFYRFIQPYSWAFPKSASRGEAMYLAAGNHEYVDGLDGYRNIILPRHRIGGWRTPQQGSYFAVTLPRGWVMLVLDIGKEPEDIDEFQRDWFNEVLSGLDADEKIILVYHLPDWIKCGTMGFTNMLRLREWRKALGDRVRLVLTGDLHYYRRMAEPDPGADSVAAGSLGAGGKSARVMQQLSGDGKGESGTDGPEQVFSLRVDDGGEASAGDNCFRSERTQYIIAGHGGAFNHATHFPAVTHANLVGEDKVLHKQCDFPTPEKSRQVWLETWPFMFISTTNHVFSRVLAGLYVTMFLAVGPSAYALSGQATALELLEAAYSTAFLYLGVAPLVAITTIMVTANFEINTCHKATVSTSLIVLHTGAHTCLAFALRLGVDAVLLSVFAVAGVPTALATFGYCLCANLLMFFLGSLLGPVLTMLYFVVSVHVFDWHYNEAISMIQVEDFKGFLRIGIAPSGDLELYSIVTDKSPSDWEEVDARERTRENPSKLRSAAIDYYLLEKVTIARTPETRDE